MKGVTLYSGLSQYYFRTLLKTIVQVGRLRRPGITILDFGCGSGELKHLLKDAKVIGYDIIPSLSDVGDWRSVQFDVLVANEVFCFFSENDLEKLLLQLKNKKKDLELVIGISSRGLLNRIGMYLFGRPGAHSACRISAKKELEILTRHCTIIRRGKIFTLANVYSFAFKNP
jgi:SAM-dependent methyltransferase